MFNHGHWSLVWGEEPDETRGAAPLIPGGRSWVPGSQWYLDRGQRVATTAQRQAGAGHDFEGTDRKEPAGARAEFPNPLVFPGNLISKMSVDLAAEFRSIPILADLSEEGLRWLADHAEEYVFQPGEILVREGDPADAMIIYLEGETDGRRESLGPDAPVYTARSGQVTGMLPFL